MREREMEGGEREGGREGGRDGWMEGGREGGMDGGIEALNAFCFVRGGVEEIDNYPNT